MWYDVRQILAVQLVIQSNVAAGIKCVEAQCTARKRLFDGIPYLIGRRIKRARRRTRAYPLRMYPHPKVDNR